MDIDYKSLYILQDKVLDIVFSFEHDLYLTGGTALSRFYKEKRYSDDLDFFANSSNLFSTNVKKIKNLLSKTLNVKLEVESKDFIRFLVNDTLQVDFINDRVPRYKDIVIIKDYKIDNIENILSNKITAIMGRDNPKDIFDVYLISKYFDVNWHDILLSAKEKSVFLNEDLIFRLKSFPLVLLKNIKLLDECFLDDFEKEFIQIIDQIKENL